MKRFHLLLFFCFFSVNAGDDHFITAVSQLTGFMNLKNHQGVVIHGTTTRNKYCGLFFDFETRSIGLTNHRKRMYSPDNSGYVRFSDFSSYSLLSSSKLVKIIARYDQQALHSLQISRQSTTFLAQLKMKTFAQKVQILDFSLDCKFQVTAPI